MNFMSVTLPEHLLLIDGKRVSAASGRSFDTIDPATGEVLARIAEADAADVDIAVAAARRALEGPWGRMSGAARAAIMRRLAELLRRDFDALAELESRDAGKPIMATKRQDLPAAIDCVDYYAGWADKIHGDTVPTRSDALTYTVRAPVGVVAAIVPWNFPLMIGMWKLAPALACGCTIVLKPAELTPLTALRLGELALEAGVPPGVLNIVPGYGTTAGAALVSHPGVDKISFTGSPLVGRQIMRAAAENVTKVGLELGGKSPNIVFADADLDMAVKQASSGIFFNAGQVCSAGSRILVQDGIHDEFAAKLIARAKGLRMGDTLDRETTLGPVISAKQRDKILGYVETGKQEKATLALGGAAVGEHGFFLQPTVFTDVANDMQIAREEIFGPVAALIRFTDEADAIRQANASSYSLAAAVWSRDVMRVHDMARKLRAGTVWVNTYGPTDTRLPWGGSGGDSGLGRDLGRAALDNYTEAKTVWINLKRAS